jgi:2,4-dienoyl-CoA reductase-like NADH-dependent reductase (Old Yellow Enzyme family)
VVYVGGVATEEDVLDVLEAGFSFVQMGRGLIREPGFVKNLQEHLQQPEPLCDHCNRCVAAMDAGGVYCVSQKQGFI